MSLDYKNMKKGSVFYEVAYGRTYTFTLIEEPTRLEDVDNHPRWTFKGRGVSGNIQEFVITEGFEHYGPKLYDKIDGFPYNE